ncbi:MAG: serine/threonine-protein kinase [Polyangiales bacterium]
MSDSDHPLPELDSRFERTETLLVGQTGTLYRAREVSTDRSGVLKVLHESITDSASERMRLSRDLRKLSELRQESLHVPIDSGQIGERIWVFRTWVEGRSLSDTLQEGGALELSRVKAITAKLANALEALHRAGLIHRDLQPAHILLSENNGVHLIDACIAPPISASDGRPRLGTIPYISPEAASGRLVSSRADLYALGAVLVEMLTGEKAFGADSLESLQALRETPFDVSSFDGWDESMRGLVLGCSALILQNGLFLRAES